MIKQCGILHTGKKIALCTILTLTVTLNAKHDVKQFEIMPFVGFNSFDSDSAMQDSSIYGIRGTYNFDKLYGIRLSYENASGVKYNDKYRTLATSTTTNKTDLSRFFGELVVDGEEEYDVVPYVFLGLGYESLSNEIQSDVSQGLLDAGIGFRYQAWKNINFSVEGKILRKFDTQDFDYTLSLGLGYIFGKSYVYPNCNTNLYNCKNSSKNLILPPMEQQISTIDPMSIPTNINEIPLESNLEVLTDIPAIVEQRVDISDQENFVTDINMIPQSSEHISVINQNQLNIYQQTISTSGKYYVQMAVWYKNVTDKKLINKIQSHNRPYKIVDTMRNNKDVKLIVVGPFQTKAEAKANLRDLKSIKRDAFITTL